MASEDHGEMCCEGKNVSDTRVGPSMQLNDDKMGRSRPHVRSYCMVINLQQHSATVLSIVVI